MAPPSCSTNRRVMWRPSPRPPKRRESELSPWRNISKIVSRSAGAMPMPVSDTVSTSCASVIVTHTVTRPCSVNLQALPTRFRTITVSLPIGEHDRGTSAAAQRAPARGRRRPVHWPASVPLLTARRPAPSMSHPSVSSMSENNSRAAISTRARRWLAVGERRRGPSRQSRGSR
jgi:hypothetical protein